MFKVGDKVFANGEKGTVISASGDFVSVLYDSNISNITHKDNVCHDFQLDEWVEIDNDTIIMRNVIKYQVFDTQLNKVVNTFDNLKDAENTLYRLNKSAINIGEEFENGNIAVKVENVDLVSEEVEVVIYHCGQPFYSSYDLGKFLREFKKCVQ